MHASIAGSTLIKSHILAEKFEMTPNPKIFIPTFSFESPTYSINVNEAGESFVNDSIEILLPHLWENNSEFQAISKN